MFRRFAAPLAVVGCLVLNAQLPAQENAPAAASGGTLKIKGGVSGEW